MVFLSCSKEVAIDCIPDNLDRSVIAYYSFSKGSLQDQSGKQGNLKNKNGVQFGKDRQENHFCAARFDHTFNQILYVNGDFTNNLQNNSFSVSLWYMAEDAFEEYEVLISRTKYDQFECPDKYGEWSLGLYDCRKAVAAVNRNSVWENKINLDSILDPIPDPIPDSLLCDGFFHAYNSNVWKHAVFTFNNKKIAIYINGKLQEIASGDAQCGYNSRNIGDIVLGKYYTGFIDDVIILNKELNEAEVLELYNMQPCCN